MDEFSNVAQLLIIVFWSGGTDWVSFNRRYESKAHIPDSPGMCALETRTYVVNHMDSKSARIYSI